MVDKRKLIASSAFFFSLLLFFFLTAGISEVDMDSSLFPPSLSHPFGTDIYGRDVLSRLSFGSLISIALSSLITVTTTIVGLLIAFLMDRKGIVSSLSFLFSNTMKSLNPIILALFLSSVFHPGFMVIFISISISHIPDIARTAYSRITIIKKEEFVLYAKAEGMGDLEIAVRHILPHLRKEVLTQSISIFSSSILTESALSFLGAGIPVLLPSIGGMLSEGRPLLLSHPSLVLIPSAVLFLISLALHLMHDALDFDS